VAEEDDADAKVEPPKTEAEAVCMSVGSERVKGGLQWAKRNHWNVIRSMPFSFFNVYYIKFLKIVLKGRGNISSFLSLFTSDLVVK